MGIASKSASTKATTVILQQLGAGQCLVRACMSVLAWQFGIVIVCMGLAKHTVTFAISARLLAWPVAYKDVIISFCQHDLWSARLHVFHIRNQLRTCCCRVSVHWDSHQPCTCSGTCYCFPLQMGPGVDVYHCR